jgi:LPXTG-motif cell wall-anchored protein
VTSGQAAAATQLAIWHFTEQGAVAPATGADPVVVALVDALVAGAATGQAPVAAPSIDVHTVAGPDDDGAILVELALVGVDTATVLPADGATAVDPSSEAPATEVAAGTQLRIVPPASGVGTVRFAAEGTVDVGTLFFGDGGEQGQLLARTVPVSIDAAVTVTRTTPSTTVQQTTTTVQQTTTTTDTTVQQTTTTVQQTTTTTDTTVQQSTTTVLDSTETRPSTTTFTTVSGGGTLPRTGGSSDLLLALAAVALAAGGLLVVSTRRSV